jgi:hypothetical protein
MTTACTAVKKNGSVTYSQKIIHVITPPKMKRSLAVHVAAQRESIPTQVRSGRWLNIRRQLRRIRRKPPTTKQGPICLSLISWSLGRQRHSIISRLRTILCTYKFKKRWRSWRKCLWKRMCMTLRITLDSWLKLRKQNPRRIMNNSVICRKPMPNIRRCRRLAK